MASQGYGPEPRVVQVPRRGPARLHGEARRSRCTDASATGADTVDVEASNDQHINT
jgi:hypothetical protein